MVLDDLKCLNKSQQLEKYISNFELRIYISSSSRFLDTFLILQSLAEENTARRNTLVETHTMGPRTHAQAKETIVCTFLN